METDRVALIRYALPDGARYAGSGLLIDEYHVLTADHVAAGLPGTYQVEFNEAKVGVAEVLRTGTPEIDLAVLILASPVQGFARLSFARVSQDRVAEVGGCVAVGFPHWRKEGSQRRSTQVNGTVPTADGFMPATGGGLAAGWLTLIG